MYLINKIIPCSSRSDRIEIFPFFDCHVGKRNCAEGPMRQQVNEILKRSKMPHRHAFVLFGGDQVNAINPADLRRFDFDELADWFVEDNALTTREMLSDVCSQEIKRFVGIFSPIKNHILGAIYGNHEKSMRTKQNVNVHQAICDRLGMVNLTDEAIVRLRFKRPNGAGSTLTIYLRHGYGAGRTPGAEPNKLARMVAEWECADVCLSGHSHSYCIMPPKAVAYIPRRGRLDPDYLEYRYRFGANPGCWLYSHLPGPGSYESAAAYPAKAMMTLKIVIWPFWQRRHGGREIEQTKIELREYPIL